MIGTYRATTHPIPGLGPIWRIFTASASISTMTKFLRFWAALLGQEIAIPPERPRLIARPDMLPQDSFDLLNKAMGLTWEPQEPWEAAEEPLRRFWRELSRPTRRENSRRRWAGFRPHGTA